MKLKPWKTKLRIFLVTEFLKGGRIQSWEHQTSHNDLLGERDLQSLKHISMDKAFGTHLLLKLHKLVLL